MMGFVGNGVQSSSSSSNLSPLATPFTVDRSTSKQNPQYPHPPPLPFTTTTSSTNNWKHNSSSSRLDLFPSSDLCLDSIRTTPLASSTDFCYNSTTNNTWSHQNPSPGPVGNPGSYYTPYDPPLPPYDPPLPYVSPMSVVDNDVPPIQPSYDFLTSRSLSGIAEWGGLWKGSSTDGKLMTPDGGTVCSDNASLPYKSYTNRGVGCEIDSTFTLGNHVDGFGREDQDKSIVGKNRTSIPVEMSSNFLTKNDHLSSSRARSGFNVSDINVVDGFLLKVENSDVAVVNSSDNLDSPCWKGAPATAAHMSASFEVVDQQQQQKHFLTKKLEAPSSSTAGNLSNREGGIHIFPPYADPLKSRQVFGTSFQNETTSQQGSNSGSSVPLEVSVLPTREHCNKSTDHTPKRNSSTTKAIQSINKNLKAIDSKQQIGVEVDFLSSQRINLKPDAVNTHEKTIGRESGPDMDVHMLVKAMQNLSELLLFQCAHDGVCTLDKEDVDALKQITDNLYACNSSYPNKKKNKTVVHTSPTKHQPKTFAQSTSHQHDMVGGSASQFIADEGGMKRDDIVRGKSSQKNYAQLFTALRDDNGSVISKDYHVIQDIKKVLDEDFECEEELESSGELFKNLWLEAQAELCISNYRTRFERFRKTRETEKYSNKLGLGTAKDDVLQNVAEKASNRDGLETCEVSDRPKEPASNSHVGPSTKNEEMEDVESSVMARFQILKSRTINQEGKMPALATEVTQVEENNNKNFQVAVGPSYLQDDDLVYYGYYENEKELNVCVSGNHDPMMEPPYDIWKNNNVIPKLSSSAAATWYNSSLDWEHVLKDDFVLSSPHQSSLQWI